MIRVMMLCVSMLMPGLLWAQSWQLAGDGSTVNFVSVKKGSVGEVHHFESLSGQIDGSKASVSIDLASVESGIGVRNERMRSMLFEVAQFATAEITADLAGVDMAAMKAGELKQLTLPLTVSLHGVVQGVNADLIVVTLADGALLVSSSKPVIIKAADFKLGAGIEALREVAKLSSIAHAVPVSFTLYFQPK